MKEVWKAIAGYEGLYEVSSLGRVRSVERMVKGYKGTLYKRNAAILKPCVDHRGYYNVNLSNNASGHTYKVHRLVAAAFIPNPENLPMVNHKDECKTNNRIDNLEWCTSLYNSNYGTARDRCAWKRIAVSQYDMKGNYLRSYRSIAEAAKAVGSARQNIWDCLFDKRRNHKSAAGYIWKIKDCHE